MKLERPPLILCYETLQARETISKDGKQVLTLFHRGPLVLAMGKRWDCSLGLLGHAPFSCTVSVKNWIFTGTTNFAI